MIREKYERASEIFAEAIDVPMDDRAAFLDRACEGDRDLLKAVRRLLGADETKSMLDDLFEPAPASESAGLDPASVESIGSYRVKRLLAEGGMGAVFLAEQQSPAREVAVKLLSRSGPAARGFASEAAALARLQHPGIARVYEAGDTDIRLKGGGIVRGAFLAMDYIEGQTLADHARANSLKRAEITRILLGIAEAIEHAHQRGVIHRDLKPTNILIDAEGKPFVIDFGVGLIRTDDAAASGGSIAGTIAYMAPEQLLGQLDRIDTRVDIYSIGAIGWELATGRPPHEGVRTLDEALLSRLAASDENSGGELERAVGSELAAVISRAMKPDPEKRYGSASQLATDLRCVAEGRPVGGEDASAWRSLVFYARRHRVAAAALGLSASLLVIATAGMAMTSSSARAVAAEAELAREAARTEKLHAERIADFLKSSFLGVDPEERGAAVTLFDAIDYAAGRIHRDLADVPEVEADVRLAIGFVYRRHGRFADAIQQTRIAHRLHGSLHGADDPRTLEATEELNYLTWLYEGDADSATRGLTELLGRVERSGPQEAWVRIKIAAIALASDQPDIAREHLTAAEPVLVEAYGDVFRARTTRHLATVTMLEGDGDEAESLARRALSICDGAAEQEYIAARCRLSLGVVLASVGKHEEARDVLGRARAEFARLVGPSSTEAADVEAWLARSELSLGNAPAARAHAKIAHEIRRSCLAPNHPERIGAEALLVACEAVNSADYLSGFEQAYDLIESAYGPDHHRAIELLREARRFSEAAGDSHTVRRLSDTLSVLTARRRQRLFAGGI